ncbi:AraC family two component transcriptional regulator [Scopulibacillus darangshiensis]|uniref:AraC family two component transcriptional regulator n=1 Tax=Scopulibacillus darangshiensis TaxID=442528 RepID=A0A4R2P9N4_9BACL|nr:helix-turn-helix domain-containing protein [Scopulibacillus darangshiensis]TCP30934.1 AraC family two component transcriptional regulator [Scopulibacillus darangshiensis]
MASILIADRDQTERTGIQWFIQSNRIQFDHMAEVADVEEMARFIENQRPEVVVIELEMIPANQMTEISLLFRRHVKKVICLTAEGVFERALQAIEFQSMALLIKPLSQEQLKRSLLQATQQSLAAPNSDKALAPASGISYAALFMTQPLEQIEYSLILLRPEEKDSIPALYHWLEQYPLPYPVQYFALSKDIVCVLQVPKQNEEAVLQQEGQRILQRWTSEYSNRRLSLAIHPASIPAESLHDMYMITKDLFKLSFFKGLQQVFRVKEDGAFHTIDPFLTPEEQRVWMRALEEGDKQGVKNWLYQHFTDFQPPYPEPELLRVRFTSILAQLRRFMKTYHLDQISEIEKRYHGIFQTVLSAPVLFSIVQEVILFIFDLMDGAAKQKENSATDVIERGLRFMEQNYHIQGFGLQEVADHVGMSPSYYSHLMTQTKGETFREILTAIRVNKARRLLAETTMTVQEITERIGFADPNYFSRVFKKETGQTPRVYRQREKSKESRKK